MKIIKADPTVEPAIQLASNLNNSIFLAGPCPRKDYSNDWRNKAFEILEKLGFDGNVITPTNDRFLWNKLRGLLMLFSIGITMFSVPRLVCK